MTPSMRFDRRTSSLIATVLLACLAAGCGEEKVAERPFPTLIEPRPSDGSQADNQRFAKEWIALGPKNAERMQAYRESPASDDFRKTNAELPRVHMWVDIIVWTLGLLLVGSLGFAAWSIAKAMRRGRTDTKNEVSF